MKWFMRPDRRLDLGSAIGKILQLLRGSSFAWLLLNLSLRRNGDDRAAVLAGPQFLVAGELLIDLSHRIGTVIADLDGGFVNFLAALIAEPSEMIDLSGPTLALEDDEPGIFLESRRVRHPGGTKEDLAGFYVGRLFFAVGCSIDQMLHAGQLQRHFVRRVDMKIPAFVAPAAQERDGFRILPQHAAAFSFAFHVFDDASEIDRDKVFHEATIALSNPAGQACVLETAAISTGEIPRSLLRCTNFLSEDR